MEQQKAGRSTARRSSSLKRRTSGKRPASSTKRPNKKNIVIKKEHIKYIAGGAVLVLLAIFLIFAVKSCGVSHKTPEKLVRTLVKSYVDGNEKKIKNCYGVKKADKDLQNEIDATIKYFQAHKPEKVEIVACDKIYQNGKNAYMYVTYNLLLENGQSYPCISTYMTQQKDDKKYDVLAPSQVTEDMQKEAATKYAAFMKTDAYKDYVTAYETFTKKNPGYEEKLATKLNG